MTAEPFLRIDAGGPPSEPVFAAPWQAQAFSMAVHLHARGVFTWSEWAKALARQVAAHTVTIPGDDDATLYYRQWLAALEQLVEVKGVASVPELQRCAAAWDHAADRTPHGQPIELINTDYVPAPVPVPAP